MLTCLFIGILMPAMRAICDLESSALTLLVTRVGADHVNDSAAPHDLAVLADFLDRGTYFHPDTCACALCCGCDPCRASALLRGATAAAQQIRLLHEPRIMVGHQMRLHLRHEVHDHHHHDQ